MATITVYRPDHRESPPDPVPLAPRRVPTERFVLGLIPNGKPRARELLEMIADEFRARGRDFEIELLQKPSAGKSITAEEATAMAARCHVVITGLGD
jgi:hypothetical protein